MPDDQKLQAAVRQLYKQLELPDKELREHFDKATDPGYWRALFPSAALTGPQSNSVMDYEQLAPDDEAAAFADLDKHGYFRMPVAVSPVAVARMRSCVEAVKNANWPAAFSFVYDDFWTIFRIPVIARLLSRHLGAGYLQTAPVWTYYISTRPRGAGWPPHVDGPRDRDRLTVWIPLSDATINNGCMYVIPRDCLPVPPSFADYPDWPQIQTHDLRTMLHHVTPLPAKAGSVLGWTHSVIHWGGQATSNAAEPRISISVEFIREKIEPKKDERPAFGANLPSFADRIRVIGQALHAYEKFEPAMRKYRGLASRLIASSN